jgi:hypothetical protein
MLLACIAIHLITSIFVMQMEDAAFTRTFFRGEPPFEAHRVKVLFWDILERSLDAVERDDDAMPVVAGPFVARVFKQLREKIDAQVVNQLVLFPHCGFNHFLPEVNEEYHFPVKFSRTNGRGVMGDQDNQLQQ